MDDEAIRTLVTRLARPHPSGGDVVERAAVLAEGGDFSAVMAWIVAHGGKPEARASITPQRGLHGVRSNGGEAAELPRRFVLPAGALS